MSARSRASRIAGPAMVGALVLVLTVAVYGVGMHELGYVWPAPQALPTTITINGQKYVGTGGPRGKSCVPLAFWAHLARRPPSSFRPVGRIKSALYFGDLQLVATHTWRLNGWVLAHVGSCYVGYAEADDSGGG